MIITPGLVIFGIIGFMLTIQLKQKRRRRVASKPRDLMHVTLEDLESDFAERKWSVDLLSALEWKRFELLTKEFFNALGFRAELTQVGADGGVDVLLFKRGESKPQAVAQCKSWKKDVGVRCIRELYGVMAANGVASGVFMTTSDFSFEAYAFAKGKALELVSGEKLIAFIKQLTAEKQRQLMETVFSGDYWTPTCVNCDVKMLRRTASKGRNEGHDFWGCPNYPRCRKIINIE